jgi:PHD-finger
MLTLRQRIEELGWDREERSYYVLDDSRLYRRTEPPLPVVPKAKPKSNTLKAQAARRRASKRRRIDTSETPEVKDEEGSVINDSQANEETKEIDPQADTLGGYKWECVAVTSEQYQEFLRTIEKTKDLNEKDLSLRIVEQVLPVVQRVEESYKRKLERKQKELFNVQRLNSAKRSSRLADRHERERQEREAVEAAEKHTAELAAAHKEQEWQAKMEQDRQSRMMTREQRIKDREYKRLLHEEELAKVAEEAKRVEAGEARGSERHLKAQMEKHKRDLEDLTAEEDWVFDCSGCGVHGKNVVCSGSSAAIFSSAHLWQQDDGAHSVACEQCNVWQHSQCLGIRRFEAEKDDFHFLCKDCKRKTEDAKRPNIKLRFRAGLSTSPPQAREKEFTEAPSPTMKFKAVEIPSPQLQSGRQPLPDQYPTELMGSPQKAANGVVPSPYLQHAASNAANGHLPYKTSQSANPHLPPTSAYSNGSQQSYPVYPYPSNPLHHQSPTKPLHANGHVFGTFQAQSQNSQSNQPALSYSNHQYTHAGAHQSLDRTQQRRLPTSSPPLAQPVANQTPRGAIGTSNTHQQGRLPSPVLNRPSMSPTQGNPDVGPVAGVPQRSQPGMGMSPPPQSATNQAQNITFTQPYNNEHYATPYMNGTPNINAENANIKPDQQPHQYSQHHLSGLSPTKHSPSLPPPALSTAQNTASPSPYVPSATSRRSISGTPIFPPTEMLQPSPKQLSKSPVPTPSKAMTPAGVGEGELKRVSDEIRDMIEGGSGGARSGAESS